MATKSASDSGFDVVPDGDGFGVVRGGDPEPISHHATREQAEEAARLHTDQGSAVDARHDLFAGAEADPSSARHTFTAAGLYALAIVVLLVVIALIVAL